MIVRQYSHDNIGFIEVKNNSKLRVVLSDLAASIYQIYFNDELITRNGATTKDFLDYACYNGKTIGRTSNRLKGYRFEINGQIYSFEPNEGNNVLHGGVHGLSTKVFTTRIDTFSDRMEVVFKYHSGHLEAGYPGNVDFKVTYIIYKDKDKFDIRYDAISDMDTLLSLTNHAYFTMGEKDISTLDLFIRGHKYISTNPADLIAIEEKEVDHVLDFSKFKNLCTDIDDPSINIGRNKGYDHYFFFDEVNPNLINIALRSKKYEMDIATNYVGTQIYSSNFLPPFKLEGGAHYIRDSVAIEPSDPFDKYPVLLKNKKYFREISYIFKLL